MRKLLLITLFLCWPSFNLTFADSFIVVDYESEIPEDYIQLDHELNKYYQLVIHQLDTKYRNRFAQIQQKWIRYRSRHCMTSSSCKINATEIQTKNLEALLLGQIIFQPSPLYKLKFDVDGEITQHSYEEVKELLLDQYEDALKLLGTNEQREYRRSYEIYNAYLYDYCELLSTSTPESFLNCQIKGLIDFQYDTKATIISYSDNPSHEPLKSQLEHEGSVQ